MTTEWLMLLVVLMSASQSVDSQSTTDDETCSDGGVLSKLQNDVERLFQQHQTLMDNQQQILHMLQQQQSMNETGRDSLVRRKFLLLLYYTIRNPTKQYGISVSPTSQYGVLSGQRLPDIFSSNNNMS